VGFFEKNQVVVLGRFFHNPARGASINFQGTRAPTRRTAWEV